MKTLRCTCGEVIRGETGAELFAAVEAHLTDHSLRALEHVAEPPAQPEQTRREEQ